SLAMSGCKEVTQTEVQQKDIIDAVFASGFIVTSEEYLVMANSEGQIHQQLVDEGSEVKPGSPLFVLSQEVQSAQLSTAEANYQDARRKASPSSPQVVDLKLKIAQARTQLEQDKKNYDRYSQLVETGAVSKVEHEQAKLQYESSHNSLERLEQSLVDLENSLRLSLRNAEDQLKIQQKYSDDYVISSVIDGKVLHLYKSQGEIIRRGETLAKIGGGNTIVKLYVAEEDINLVQEGQRTLVSLNTDNDSVYEAVVSKIFPAFDDQQQSFIVEATFQNPPSPLYPGTRLQANIVVAQKENALVIPTEFLLPGDSVLLENQSKKAIQVGIKNNQWTEVSGGLEQGNTILLSM
ncbi:MAG: HlyD family efflux transporter periplasmic adaptor subunit, partial [Bacteroidota bacterium]